MKINRKLLAISLAVIIGIIIILVFVFKESLFSIDLKQDNSKILDQNSNSHQIQAQVYSSPRKPVLQANDKIIGLAQAKLKIFVYEDYTNVFSANLAGTLHKIKNKFGDQVAIIVRPYLRDKTDLSAVIAINCAGRQGKWTDMRDLLFKNVENNKFKSVGFLNSDLLAFAKELNLNSKDFNSCLTTQEKSGKIETVNSDFLGKNIQGVPTMFVGGKIVLGARPYNNYAASNGDHVQGLETVVRDQLEKINK